MAFVALFRVVIFAWRTTAPVRSLTVPAIEAVWARADGAAQNRKRSRTERAKRLIMGLLLVGLRWHFSSLLLPLLRYDAPLNRLNKSVIFIPMICRGTHRTNGRHRCRILTLRLGASKHQESDPIHAPSKRLHSPCSRPKGSSGVSRASMVPARA